MIRFAYEKLKSIPTLLSVYLLVDYSRQPLFLDTFIRSSPHPFLDPKSKSHMNIEQWDTYCLFICCECLLSSFAV